ncbi:MAG TPA: anthranilate synthase component I family protein [Caulobacteraceae bacterium]|jgi:para-aminobenzoate synthetase component 1|nr:anthranilate synthase component I family protein [Caulobacteraceae bacterium]
MGLAADIAVQRWSAVAVLETAWRDPAAAAAVFAGEPYALLLLSDGSAGGRWSYLLRQPERVLTVGGGAPAVALAEAAALLGPPMRTHQGGPPFQGGLAGLASYELGLAYEPAVGARRDPDWPDLAAGLYPALLAFDHIERRVLALGRGSNPDQAKAGAEAALDWLAAAAPPTPAAGDLAEAFEPLGSAPAYRDAVADVVARIAAGEIFQANVARAWGGRLRAGRAPYDLMSRLAADSPAPFAAYLRLPGLAVVSNSPERFLKVGADGRVETRPIKGTRPRGAGPVQDAALAAELAASAKDRAENLMIVDLMRNDLARVCTPGSVEVPDLWRLESFANVHHLVSTVTGRLAPGTGAFDLMAAAFPPGSVTGAPKVQAMRVIAAHEPPRGPYCGSIFWAGFDGAFDSSVLIRTAAFVGTADGWRFEARAGAGIVADSDPAMECDETEAKIAAIQRAFGARTLRALP